MPYKDPEVARERSRVYSRKSYETAKLRQGSSYNVENHRKSLSSPATRATRLFYAAKNRATTRGLELTITRDWVYEKLLAGKCEVSGLSFSLSASPDPMAPSLDRIDADLGYTPENTQLVVWVYNAAKNRHTHDDVLKLAEALCQRFPPKKS